MGFLALDLGGLTPILYSFIERDEIVEMLAALTGAADALQLLPHRRRERRPEPRVHEPPRRLDEPRRRSRPKPTRALLNENEIFVRRMRGVGVLDREMALRYGVTGGNLRAAGVPFDVRRAHPYSVYPELDFNVPTRDEGDSLARYLIRVDEVRESIKIIDQCLHNMPDGPIMAKLPRLIRPRPGPGLGRGRGPRGMMGVYTISDGTDQPFRFRIHDPSFVNLQTVPADAAGQPARGHDGDRGLAGPGHGRDRQVRAARALRLRATPSRFGCRLTVRRASR
jgi:NADH-quinone oxidoreductase subunit D